MDVDTIIVGGGIAGLVAARCLSNAGHRILVLEARDRLGGRTLSHWIDGDAIDLGAQWIGPHQRHIRQLIEELGLSLFPQYCEGKKLLEIDGQIISYRNTIPALPIFGLINLQLTILRLEQMCRQVPLDQPLRSRRAHDWDAISVETWLQNNIRSLTARRVLTGVVRSLLCVEPDAVSFLFFLFYLHAGGGLLKLVEVNNGAQQYRLVGGTQQIAQRISDQLIQQGQSVLLNAPVHAIEQTADHVVVHSELGDFQSKFVISAIPPALSARINYQPALPQPQQALLSHMPMGSVIKCVAVYRYPFWREAGFSGEILSDTSPIGLAFDDTAHDQRHGALVAFLLGDSACKWSQASIDQRRDRVTREFARFFGEQATQPLHYLEQDWTTEVWSRGCYVGYLPPAMMTQYGFYLRQPFGRLHWAGSETASEGMGYMDGAVESGKRAAQEILARTA